MLHKLAICIVLLLWYGGASAPTVSATALSPLLFATQEIKVLRTTIEYGRDYEYHIQFFSLHPQTGEQQLLVEVNFNKCTGKGGQHCTLYDIMWLPHSNRVIFYALVYGIQGLYLLDLTEGAMPERLVQGSIMGGYYALSSDEQWLVYSQRSNNEDSSALPMLYSIALDGDRMPVLLLPELNEWQVYASIDPLGEYVTFYGANLNFDKPLEVGFTAYRLRLRDWNLTVLYRDPVPDQPMVWSPNGQWIAYCDRGLLFIVDRNGQNQHQLTQSPITCRNLIWLPQGDRLLYSDGRNLFIVVLGSGTTQKVFGSGASINQVHSSPDGTYLAFIRNSWLEVLPLNGSGKVQRLTQDDKHVVGIDW